VLVFGNDGRRAVDAILCNECACFLVGGHGSGMREQKAVSGPHPDIRRISALPPNDRSISIDRLSERQRCVRMVLPSSSSSLVDGEDQWVRNRSQTAFSELMKRPCQ
jgi:hypothetical protein